MQGHVSIHSTKPPLSTRISNLRSPRAKESHLTLLNLIQRGLELGPVLHDDHAAGILEHLAHLGFFLGLVGAGVSLC